MADCLPIVAPSSILPVTRSEIVLLGILYVDAACRRDIEPWRTASTAFCRSALSYCPYMFLAFLGILYYVTEKTKSTDDAGGVGLSRERHRLKHGMEWIGMPGMEWNSIMNS